MKTSLHILGIVFVCLFSMSMESCDKDDPPSPTDTITPSYEAQPAGEYELTRIEVTSNDAEGLSVTAKPPRATGTLTLIHGGSLYISYSLEGEPAETTRENTWSADATTLTAATGGPIRYTLQGTVLTLIGEDDDGLITTLTWQKKT